jgi:asparagine synthase (glutamine-hydrolysing)
MVNTRGVAPLEIATHVLFGTAATDGFPRPGAPIEALRRTIRAALAAPPCFVTFSGGRDSSAVLGLAAQVAEREGLEPPIPVTAEFPGAARSDEREWQELVLSSLKVGDWIRRAYGDELDLLGPAAADLMRRSGLPYPFNLHLLEPLIAEARGGTLVTGVGGDQVLDRAGAFRDVLSRRRRPSKREALHTLIGLSPRIVRRRLVAGTVARSYPWLTPEGGAAFHRALLERELRIPIRWDRELRLRWREREMQMNLARLGELAAYHHVDLVHPFTDPAFVSSLAHDGGAFGFQTRTVIMRRLFADVLPDELNSRQTKAWFEEVVWNRYSKAFIASLDERRLGGALDALGVAPLVDPAALLATWREPVPHSNSFMLLQGCWMALDDGAAVS